MSPENPLHAALIERTEVLEFSDSDPDPETVLYLDEKVEFLQVFQERTNP